MDNKLNGTNGQQKRHYIKNIVQKGQYWLNL